MSDVRLAYLIGTDHCGSTLTSFLLDAHSDIVGVGESTPPLQWFTSDYICGCGLPVKDCPFYTEISTRLAEQGLAFSADQWSINFSYSNQFLHRWLTQYASQHAKRRLQSLQDRYLPFHNTRVKKVKQVALEYMRAATDIAGASLMCDTSKCLARLTHLHSMPEVDVHLIWLIRDARAFAHSCKKFGLSIEKSSREWVRYQRLAGEIFETFEAGRRLRISYEDLCETPRHRLFEIHDFLGVEREPLPDTLDRKQHHVLGNKMRKGGPLEVRLDEKWRRELSDQERRHVLTIAGELNRSLGYAD